MGASLDNAVQLTLAGIALGSLYALLLLAILIVFRVSRAVNFSQGQLGMAAAVLAYLLYSRGAAPVWVALAAGVLVAALISFLTERVFLERLSRRAGAEGQDLVITLGMMLLLAAGAEFLFGTQTKSFIPLGNDVQTSVRGVFVNANQVVTLVVTVAVLVGFFLFLRTRAGVMMRASAADPDLAKSFGVDVVRVKALTWLASGLVSGVVGIVVASRLSVDPYYMTSFLINAFIAGVVGGLDRFVVPLSVTFGLGLFEVWSAYLLGSSYATAALFVLVLALLALLPKRFLSEQREARA